MDKYRFYLLTLGQEDSTIRTNIKMVQKVLKECNPLTCENFSQYISTLIGEKKSVSYIHQIVGAIKHYGKCKNDLQLASFPYPKLKRKTTFIRAVMTDEEIEAFISLPCPYDPRKKDYCRRWRVFSVFWLIMAYTGCRPAEVSRLTINDCSFGEGVFLIRQTKTGIPRQVPISTVIYDKVYAYVKSLEQDLLFPSTSDRTKPIGMHVWEDNFARRKEIMKLRRGNLSPYSLRHSFASRLVDVSIYKLKTIMGHSKITTTEKYLHTNTKALQEFVESDPLAEKAYDADRELDLAYKEIQKIEGKRKKLRFSYEWKEGSLLVRIDKKK